MKRTKTEFFNWLKSYFVRWTSTFDHWTRALHDGAINRVVHRISDHKGVFQTSGLVPPVRHSSPLAGFSQAGFCF